jgi:plastocyanin
MSRVTLGTLTGVLALLAACGGGSATGTSYANNPSPPPAPPPSPPPAPNPVESATVDVYNNYFSPATVLLAVGGMVTWNWVGSGHSVTSSGSPAFSPNAPVSNSPHTLVVTFGAAGDYQYYCTVHGSSSDPYNGASPMTGVIQVR